MRRVSNPRVGNPVSNTLKMFPVTFVKAVYLPTADARAEGVLMNKST